MVPLSLAHHLVTAHAPVKDVWRILHPDSSIGAAIDNAEKARGRGIPTAVFNLSENGTTCDSVLNTWRWNKGQQQMLGPGKLGLQIPPDANDPEGKRLDYIFVGDGKRSREPGAWVVKSAQVGMTDRHPTLQCSLSDHFSVEATLSWNGNSDPYHDHKVQPIVVESEAYLHSPTTSNSHGTEYELQLQTTPYLPVAIYDEILAMTAKYTLRERKQRRWRLYHFIGSVFISIGCLVAAWWSPRNFVGFLLMLLSTLGLSAGVIDGLIGGLFVGSELRALKEFEWEIKNTRRAAGGGGLDDAHEIVDW